MSPVERRGSTCRSQRRVRAGWFQQPPRRRRYQVTDGGLNPPLQLLRQRWTRRMASGA